MLNTATKVVGLLAGVVAVTYALGGAVIAIRMLFEGFTPATVIMLLGQLPRQMLISTALLDVAGVAAIVGLVAALAYALCGRPQAFVGDARITKGGHLARTYVLMTLATIALVLPSILIVWHREGFTPMLLTAVLPIAVTFALVTVGWHLIRLTGGKSWHALQKAALAGVIWAGVALTPALMLAGALRFEHAKVCTTDSQAPTKGLLIGESEDHVLLATDFSHEESVLSLPSDRVTKSEYGDLSSVFACPAPSGEEVSEPVAPPPLGGHGGAVERALAMKLRPRLRFDSDERWRPLEVGRFLAEKFVHGRGHGACRAGAEPPCPNVAGLDQLQGDSIAYLDVHGGGRNGASARAPTSSCPRTPPSVDCESGLSSVMYYQRTSHNGRWYWDYWWFLRYNDYKGVVNQCVVVCGDHEGDWEGVTVITTPSLDPEVVGAIYAAHKDRVMVDGSLLPMVGTHPIAFVAEGTHATYPFICARDCGQYSGLPEDGHDGAVGWPQNVDAVCAVSHCVRPLPDVGHPSDGTMPLAAAWAAWGGQWGKTCHNGCTGVHHFHESSPRSPGRQIRFKCPWAPSLEALPSPDGSGLSRSEAVGDTERQLAECAAQRGGL